jgi:hypothetical protein
MRIPYAYTPIGVTPPRAAAALPCSARSMCLLFRALPAAATTPFLLSPTTCSALVFPLVARTRARVTAAAPLSAPPSSSLVLFLGVLAVLALASPVSTPGLVLFHLSSLPTCKRVLSLKMEVLLHDDTCMMFPGMGGLDSLGHEVMK